MRQGREFKREKLKRKKGEAEDKGMKMTEKRKAKENVQELLLMIQEEFCTRGKKPRDTLIYLLLFCTTTLPDKSQLHVF